MSVLVGRVRTTVWALTVGMVGGAIGGGLVAAAPAAAQAPPAVYQVGTRGCLEVGVRPTAPFSQPRPFFVPDGYDVIAQGYPAFGYDSTGFIPTSGTN